MAENVGHIVGDRYHIVRELGHGGMGVVYLGRDLRREMDVAIKLCGRGDAHAMLWLKREFRVVASLRHPNLVELFELVAHERICYFTMEYIVGVDPRRWVMRPAQPPPLPPRDQSTSTLAPLRPAPVPEPVPVPEIDFARARSVLAQLAEALAFLHGRGVIHRDIKPSNVLVANGTAKLLDFGLALDRQRIEGELAREERIVGTPKYMAPEYVAKQTVTPAMDLYALGVLGFELITGTTPHREKDDWRAYALPRASRVNPGVPADLEELVDQMLSGNPARRPTAREVATRIAGSMTQPRPTRRVERFVGRAPELERIVRVIADPDPRARVVIARGPSGVGKTALVDEALNRARIAGVLPELGWRGRCHERELIPYRAFDFIIDDLAAELVRDRGIAATIEHAGALGRGFPSLGPALDAAQLAGPADDLRVERERALIAMTQLFDLAIADQRAIVTIDDLQWADEDSIELLAVIVARVSRPLTIIATWSDSGTASDQLATILERLGGAVEVIALEPMANVELADIIASVAPAAPLDQVRAAIAVAAGSPYLAELIARELGETGEIDPRHAETRLLARLAPGERAIVELTAIATSGTTFEQLRTLAELSPARLTSVLRSLEDAHIIKVSPSASGDASYSCYHQRLRDAAHGAIGAEARRTLHLRFAELGERGDGPPEQLAHHFEHAGERARAAKWAIVAADAARAQLAWAVATDWYARATALGETGHRQQLAECLFLGGKLAEAAEAYERLADTASDGGDRWRVRAAESFIKLGELERGLAVLDGVLDRRGQPRARNRIATTARTLGVAARWLAPWQSRAPAHDDVLAAAYRVIASFLSTPYPIEAFEYVVRSVATADRAGDRDNRGMGMAMLAVYIGISSLGRYGDRAIAAAAQSGAPYPRMVAAGAAGILATLRGDWAAMRRSHDEGHRICMKLGLQKSWEASFLRTYEALGEYYAGEPARAIAILDDLTETSDDLFARALIGSYRARALLLDGQLDAARAAEHEVAGAPVARRGLAAIYRQLFVGELALADRDWARAEAIGNELARHARREWLSAIPAVSAMIDILIATAELGLGDREAALRARARARKLERRARVSFYSVTALRLRAQAELRLGHAAEARRILLEAAAAGVLRGSKLDRLAIDRLLGKQVDLGSLAFAVRWSTAGMV